jgi:NADPH:quinone reductase
VKAAVILENGPPSVLKYIDMPDPEVGPGQVRIRVSAVSLEGGDLIHRRSVAPPRIPHVIGYQAGGFVDAIGDGVSNVSEGQRIVAFNWSGSHAELFVVPAAHIIAIPDDVDLLAAATVPVAFGTAHDSLFEFGRLQPGETVLIRGGAGGVGLAAIQLAKAAGARVIATASSAERLARLREYGMDHGINYREEDIVKATMALTDGRGADLSVDMAGGNGLRSVIRATRYRGRLSVVGASSAEPTQIEFFDIIRQSMTFYGIYFGREMQSQRAHELLAEIFARIASRELRVPIDRIFGLGEAASAHHYAETGHPVGRVVIVP